MKEKTEWKQPAINKIFDKWAGVPCPKWTYFVNGEDLRWVNYYSLMVRTEFWQRFGKIIGDE